MKQILLWTSICLLVPLTLIATQGHVSVTSAATPAPTTASITPTVVVPISTSVRAADGAVMVYVPAGEFLMGSLEDMGETSERPRHRVYLDAFWIDRTEVTNRQFEMFVKATGYRTDAEKEGTGGVWDEATDDVQAVKRADWRHPDGPDSSLAGRMDDPVLQVTWNDARAYCQWAGGALPTEAQWEKAARGTDGRQYPWGNQPASCRYAVLRDSSGVACGQGKKPWPVGSKPEGASPYGALDMAGNVWQWLADYYDGSYYSHSPASNPQGPDSGSQRTERGGSWVDIREDAQRCAARGYDDPTIRSNVDGFRCAVSPSARVGTVVTPTAVATPTAKLPGQVLFIGDELSYFLDKPFADLAASSTPPITLDNKAITQPDMPLSTYWIFGEPLKEIRSGK